MPFSWKQAKIKSKVHYFARMQSLAHCNPDFAVQHPELTKELLNDNIKIKSESKKYLDKKFDKLFKYGEVPKPSVVIKRYNRLV